MLGNVSTRVLAQTKNNSWPDGQTLGSKFAKNDLKNYLNKELTRSKLDDSEIKVDIKKLEKERINPLPKRKISKTQKVWLVVFFAALAVGVTLLAIYGKPFDCETNPPYCAPDEYCPCP